MDAYKVSLELARAIRPLISRLRTSDPSLLKQLTRAMALVPLNLAEGRQRNGKDRVHLYRVAAGSVAEVKACLDVAEALGYIEGEHATLSRELADRMAAMCWRLTH